MPPSPKKRLTAVAVPKKPPGRHADGGGLYLVVDDSGARRWVLRTLVHGRRRDIGLGGADLVSLAEARALAHELRAVARAGGDPITHRDRDKRAPLIFADAARTVHAEQIVPASKNEKAAAQWLRTIETYAFPKIGRQPVDALAQSDVLRVLQPIWLEKPETARRLRQRLRLVFDWTIAAGHREAANPCAGIEAALPRQKARARHFAALPWADLPALWPRLAAASGMGAAALRFTILTAARSGEVRGATWAEIDEEAAVWTVPAERMKAGREHRVPLAPAALAEIRALRPLARGDDDLVFPSAKPGRPLSDMTIAAVLKRLEVPVTVHGFRSTFRDWAEEATDTPHAVKEAALAHAVRDRVEAAYRRTDLFDRRRVLMDQWAAFVTGGGA